MNGPYNSTDNIDVKDFLSNNLTLIVNSCDKYSDLWYPFFELLGKYWDNCPCDIILNTESKVYVHSHKIGKGIKCLQLYNENASVDWSTRYLETLKNVKTKYVFTMLDDCFLTRKVDEVGLADLIKKIDKIRRFGAVYFSFTLNNLFKDKKTGLNRFTKWTLYKIVCYAGIWSVEELRSTLKIGESPWEYELYGRQREFNSKTKYFSIDDNISPIGLDFYAQIIKGKWSERCVKLLESQNVDVDFSKRGIVCFEPKNDGETDYPFKKIWRYLKNNIWPLFCFSEYLAYLRRGKRINGGDKHADA